MNMFIKLNISEAIYLNLLIQVNREEKAKRFQKICVKLPRPDSPGYVGETCGMYIKCCFSAFLF